MMMNSFSNLECDEVFGKEDKSFSFLEYFSYQGKSIDHVLYYLTCLYYFVVDPCFNCYVLVNAASLPIISLD